MAGNDTSSASMSEIQAGVDLAHSRLKSASANYTMETHRTVDLLAMTPAAPLALAKLPPGHAIVTSPAHEKASVRWAFSAQKVLSDSRNDFWGRLIAVYDGHAAYTFQGPSPAMRDNAPQGSIRNRLPGYLAPLDFGYTLNGKWIGDILRESGGSLVSSGRDPLFGTVREVQCARSDGSVYRFWFASERDYLAIRAELEVPDQSHEGGRTLTRIVCSRAGRSAGVWFPLAGIREWLQIPSDNSAPLVLLKRDEYNASGARCNSVPDNVFVLHYPAGTMVWDAINRKRYYMGSADERTLDPRTDRSLPEYGLRVVFVLSVAGLVATCAWELARRRRRQSG
jgi:hypothetical protein